MTKLNFKTSKDDPEGPIEYKKYQVVRFDGVDYLKIDLEWGSETAQFYLQ